MDFLNAWWMYLIASVVVLFILSQSLFFLLKARKRALELGISKERIKRTIISTMIFSIAPSIAILIGLLTLSKVLGIVIPWIRLSVLGAVTYELPATINVVEGVYEQSIGNRITDPKMFITVIWVMTFGVIPPLVIIPLFLKKIQARVIKTRMKDHKWGDIFMSAMFLGMISAFLGYVVAPRTIEETGETYISITSILTLLSSAGIMVLCGVLITKYKQSWLKNYAISLSMILAMALAILYTALGVR
ncbi:MAG: DUF5058 family protein [Bacillota bacterium]